ncbi:MAG TPA: hypothetical protein VHP83_25415 [Aggregatilineaceae bacterium]|nr:hypothetical protein [Aggregatilineaceae bacterium]
MLGYLVLHGGDAYNSQNKNLDHLVLQLIRRGRERVRLVVIPAAAIKNPEKEALDAVHYYKNLGTYPDYKMFIDQASANVQAEVDVLDKVEVIVLTDGSPIDTVERLKGTKVEAALRRAIEERKGEVIAAGASAMAMGGVYWLDGEWEPGIGIAPHLAILTHHEHAQMRLDPERLLEKLPEGITLIGVDELTALICNPDGSYSAAGQGEVVVYRSVEQQDVYQAGQNFTL